MILLRYGDQSANIALVGAELKAYQKAKQQFIWPGDAKWWSYSAPLLFPIVGKLPGGQISHEGRVLQQPQHGFARLSQFAVVEQAPSWVELVLQASEATRPDYPFEFELRVRYTLQPSGLQQDVWVKNAGAAPMPASFGFHPAFLWPMRSGRADQQSSHWLEFESPQSTQVARLDAQGALIPNAHASPLQGARLILDASLFKPSAVIFETIQGQSVTFGDALGPLLRMHWSGCQQFAIWCPPGAPFVCLEPWHGLAAPAGFAGVLAEKPGGFMLPSGASRQFGLQIIPSQ